MNKNKFRACVVAHGDSLGRLADKIGVGKSTLSAKINGHSSLRIEEAQRMVEIYNLSADEAFEIFFE